MNDYKTFSFDSFRHLLRRLCDTRPHAVTHVAKEIGITQATLSRYLTGARKPDLRYIIALSQYFRVSIDFLVGIDCTEFDHLNPEMQNLVKNYSIATEEDRAVIQAVLRKYDNA